MFDIVTIGGATLDIFFQSSQFFHSRVRAAEKTGRFRMELSSYFKTKEEESNWFVQQEMSELPRVVMNYLKKRGTEYIKEIPFSVVWDAFWSAKEVHIFVEEVDKAAVVYAYNSETK